MGKLLLAVLTANRIIAKLVLVGGGRLERHSGRFRLKAVRPLE
jgi:hypothetical protein